eukprot:gene15448-18326_t
METNESTVHLRRNANNSSNGGTSSSGSNGNGNGNGKEGTQKVVEFEFENERVRNKYISHEFKKLDRTQSRINAPQRSSSDTESESDSEFFLKRPTQPQQHYQNRVTNQTPPLQGKQLQQQPVKAVPTKVTPTATTTPTTAPIAATPSATTTTAAAAAAAPPAARDFQLFALRPSLLSSESNGASYKGFLNLLVLLMIVTSFRLVILNHLTYGIRLDLGLLAVSEWHRWPGVLIGLSLNFYIIGGYLIEKGASNNLLPATIFYYLRILNGFAMVLLPSSSVVLFSPNPASGIIVMIFVCVVGLKMISYHYENNKQRCMHPETKKFVLDSKDVTVYPNNLSLKNTYWFMLVPTLVYQLSYPRSPRIRKGYLLRRILEALFLSALIFWMVEQYMVPLVENSVRPMEQNDLVRIIERVMKLSLPNLYVWLLGFYVFFHLYLNICAELTRFGDREFYRDWWNSTGLDYFWRTWNMPVHQWMVVMIYTPMRRRGWSKQWGYFMCFFVSAIFHELVISVPFHTIKLWAFFGIMSQMVLIAMTKNSLNGKNVGNEINLLTAKDPVRLDQLAWIDSTWNSYVDVRDASDPLTNYLAMNLLPVLGNKAKGLYQFNQSKTQDTQTSMINYQLRISNGVNTNFQYNIHSISAVQPLSSQLVTTLDNITMVNYISKGSLLVIPRIPFTLDYSFFDASPVTPPFPFGVASGSVKNAKISYDSFYSSYAPKIELTFTYYDDDMVSLAPGVPGNDFKAPVIISYQSRAFGAYSYIVRVAVQDDISGVYNLKFNQNFDGTMEAKRIQGPESGSGISIFEAIVSLATQFTVRDYCFNAISSLPGPSYIVGQDTVTWIPPVGYPNQWLIDDITYVGFQKNTMDVTNKTDDNVLYFKIPNADPTLRPKIMLIPQSIDYLITLRFINRPDLQFTGYYDPITEQYAIPFTIGKNEFEGPLIYSILLESKGSINGELFRVKFVPGNDLIERIIGWNITIEDAPNGLEYGYIDIYSDLNPVALPNSNSISQVFRFSTYLRDTVGNIAESDQNTIDPLYNVYNSTQLAISVTFPTPSESIPVLTSFSVHPNSIDVGSLNRTITVLMTASSGVGIKHSNCPVVYISSLHGAILPFKSVNIPDTDSFRAVVELPYGFGYLDKLFFSVYGIYDNTFNMAGYSTSDLDTKSFTSNITRTFTYEPYFVVSSFSNLAYDHGLAIFNVYLTNVTSKGTIYCKSVGFNCGEIGSINNIISFRLLPRLNSEYYVTPITVTVSSFKNPLLAYTHQYPSFFHSNKEAIIMPKSTVRLTQLAWIGSTWNSFTEVHDLDDPIDMFLTINLRPVLGNKAKGLYQFNQTYSQGLVKSYDMLTSNNGTTYSFQHSISVQSGVQPLPGITFQTLDDITMIHFSIVSNLTIIPNQPFTLEFSRNVPSPISPPFPYGISSGSVINANVSFDTFFSSHSPDILLAFIYYTTINTGGIGTASHDNKAPTILSYESSAFGAYSYIVRVAVQDDISGVYHVQFDQLIHGVGMEAKRIQGTDSGSGISIFEAIVSLATQFTVRDFCFNSLTPNYVGSYLVTQNTMTWVPPAGYPNQWLIDDITYVGFQKNTMDVTNKTDDNVLYFKIPDADPTLQPEVMLIPESLDFSERVFKRPDLHFTGYYDPIAQQYAIPFTIRKNEFEVPGNDLIERMIGWNITIEDAPNGLEYGYIDIYSDLNPVAVRVYLDDIFRFSTYLRDTAGNIAESDQNTIDPLYNVYNSTQLAISVTFPTPSESIPVLTSFSVHPNSIDVGSLNRTITVLMTASSGVGIKHSNCPVVYISSLHGAILPFKSVNIPDSDSFRAVIELPYGFGYLDKLFFSVYGIYDNNLNMAGYSTNDLTNKLFTSNITRTITYASKE